MHGTLSLYVIAIILTYVVAFGVNEDKTDSYGEINPRAGAGKGEIGNDLTYSLEGDTLTISGTGEMFDFNSTFEPPWKGQRMKKVIIGEGVTSIGVNAFNMMSSIESVELPSSLKLISNYSFSGSGLKSVTIPVGVEAINYNAFSYCTFMENVTLPYTLKTIGGYAFNACTALVNITIPDGVISIGTYAFSSCTSLKNFNIPRSLKTIEEATFWSSLIESVSFPDGVTVIEQDAFLNCRKLKTIIIPESVTLIGERAFKKCSALESVTIPESVSSIGEAAFDECEKLESVFYQGFTDISDCSAAFSSSISNVCVPLSYDKQQFCGIAVSTVGICEIFMELCNHCFKAEYADDGWIQQKRKSATEMEESLSLGCAQYQCQNNTGEALMIPTCNEGHGCYKKEGQCNKTTGICDYEENDEWNTWMKQKNFCNEIVCEGSRWVIQRAKDAPDNKTENCIFHQCTPFGGMMTWSLCNSTSDVTRICVNEKCIENKVTIENRIVVEITIEEGVNIKEMNASEIMITLSDKLKIDSNEMSVGFENDANGNILRVLLYVKDEETAKVIVDAVKGIEKGKGCGYGLLCRTKTVRLMTNEERAISGTRNVHKTKMTIALFLMAVLELIIGCF